MVKWKCKFGAATLVGSFALLSITYNDTGNIQCPIKYNPVQHNLNVTV